MNPNDLCESKFHCTLYGGARDRKKALRSQHVYMISDVQLNLVVCLPDSQAHALERRTYITRVPDVYGIVVRDKLKSQS